MGEQHGLGMLHVGVTGQHHVEVGLRLLHEHMAQLEVGLHELSAARLGVEPRVGGHLVVAAAARMQPRAGRADAPGELALDGHVDVLVVDIEGEGPGLDVGLDAIEALGDGLGILVADDALGGQHGGVGLRTRDVLGVQLAVDGQRSAEALREGVGAFLEPSRPECH